MKILFLESVAGVAGDMFAASFIHAGLLDPQAAEDVPRQLGLDNTRVVISPVKRTGIAALHLDVVVNGEEERGHTHEHDNHHATPSTRP